MMSKFYVKPIKLKQWMMKEMRWTYSFDKDDEKFWYTIGPANQTMEDDLNDQLDLDSKKASKDTLKQLWLPFDFDKLQNMKMQLSSRDLKIYSIHEVLTLLITDLMSLMNQDLPDLFYKYQKMFASYTISFDTHLGENCSIYF